MKKRILRKIKIERNPLREDILSHEIIGNAEMTDIENNRETSEFLDTGRQDV